MKEAPKINQDSNDDVCRFIDKYITAVVPKGVLESENDANIMKSLQNIHIQTTVIDTNHVMHPASRTVISCQPSEEDKADDIFKCAKDVLQKVQNVLSSIDIANEDLAIEDLLQKVGIDLDTYMQA